MPLPSLMREGSIIPHPSASKTLINKLKKTRAIDYIVDWVKDRLVEYGAKPAKSICDRVLIVRARTGSGKSTAMPVELYRLFNPNVGETLGALKKGTMGTYEGGNILCTQPRVLTAQDIPTELSNPKENPWASDMILGKTIGYSTGTAKILCTNCLLYATLDTLLAQLRSKSDVEIMDMYRMIILDEVHERSITFDMVIMLLKEFIGRVYKEPKCPIVIFTSATFDVEKYAQYLGVSPINNVIDVEGLTYPVKDIYLSANIDNYIDEAAKIIDRIHNKGENPRPNGEHDILVFLPGKGEMRKLKEALLKYFDHRNPFMFSILDRGTVTSTTAFRDLKLPYEELLIDEKGEYDKKNGKMVATRRIFMGTVVAETGITISTLGYVIDSGLINNREFYFPYGINGLLTKPEAKSRSKQRRGRVGRKFEGYAYYLFTEETYSALMNIQYPDIIYQDMNREFISLCTHGLDVDKLDMLDNPPIDSLKYALTMSINMGYYDYETCKLTEMGSKLRSTQYITLSGFRSILSSYAYEVATTDMITVLAMIDWRVPRKLSVDKILKESLPAFFFDPSVESHVVFFRLVTLDQFVEYLFYFEAFVGQLMQGISSTKKWCRDVGLDFDDMILIASKRNELINDLGRIGYGSNCYKENRLALSTGTNYFDRLCRFKQCMYDGYLLNLLKWNKETMRYHDRFGNHIRVKSLVKDIDIRCDLILTDNTTFASPDMDSYKKILEASKISVLDGYIGIRYF